MSESGYDGGLAVFADAGKRTGAGLRVHFQFTAPSPEDVQMVSELVQGSPSCPRTHSKVTFAALARCRMRWDSLTESKSSLGAQSEVLRRSSSDSAALESVGIVKVPAALALSNAGYRRLTHGSRSTRRGG